MSSPHWPQCEAVVVLWSHQQRGHLRKSAGAMPTPKGPPFGGLLLAPPSSAQSGVCDIWTGERYSNVKMMATASVGRGASSWKLQAVVVRSDIEDSGGASMDRRL